MEPYTENQKATHLLTKIHPEMRQKLLEGGYTQRAIMTRESLVNTIVMLETTANWVKDHRAGTGKDQKGHGGQNSDQGGTQV